MNVEQVARDFVSSDEMSMETSKVSIGLKMSLDGFIAGPNDEVDELFKSLFMGATDHTVSSGNSEFKMSSEGAEIIEEAGHSVGALVTGRRTFDIAHAWGGRKPMNVPIVVVTHNIPQEWVKKRLTLHIRYNRCGRRHPTG